MRNIGILMIAVIFLSAVAGVPAEETDSSSSRPIEVPPNSLGLSTGIDSYTLMQVNVEYRRWLGKLVFSAAAGSARNLSGGMEWCLDFYGTIMYKEIGNVYGLVRSGYTGMMTSQWR